MTILFTVTVDTEEEWDWNRGWPTSDLSLKNIELLPRFQEFCDRYGFAATYFTDHAVLASPAARETVLSLAERPNVEIGMHIHPWNTPPINGCKPIRARETFIRNLPLADIKEKLATVYDAFHAVQLAPTSFRGGRYSSGGPVHDFLQDHGFVADASICPFSCWADDGAPDYHANGLEPRRLSPKKAGQTALWEIPLTLAFTRRPFHLWSRLYRIVEESWLSKLRLIGIVERLGIVRKVWLNFESPLSLRMTELLERLQDSSVQCICFTLHSSSLLPGGNPFTPTKDDAARLFERVDSAFRWLSSQPQFQPATVTQVAQHLEKQFHANTGN